MTMLCANITIDGCFGGTVADVGAAAAAVAAVAPVAGVGGDPATRRATTTTLHAGTDRGYHRWQSCKDEGPTHPTPPPPTIGASSSFAQQHTRTTTSVIIIYRRKSNHHHPPQHVCLALAKSSRVRSGGKVQYYAW